MDCRQFVDRLSPFLDDELDPVASREVSLHLEACASCAAAFDQQRKLRESLKQSLEYHRAPDLLRARVMRDLRAAGRGVDAAPRLVATPWRWLSTLAAAAAVVAVVSGTWMAS